MFKMTNKKQTKQRFTKGNVISVSVILLFAIASIILQYQGIPIFSYIAIFGFVMFVVYLAIDISKSRPTSKKKPCKRKEDNAHDNWLHRKTQDSHYSIYNDPLHSNMTGNIYHNRDR